MAASLPEIMIEIGESAEHRKRPKLTRTRRFKLVSLEAFLSLLDGVRRRPEWLRYSGPKADVYSRLMRDLENEEEANMKLFLFVRITLLLGLVAALVVTVIDEGVNRRMFLRLWSWQWAVLAIVFFSGISLVPFTTFLVFTLAKWLWRLKRQAVYFLREIKWCVDTTLWLGLVLGSWYLWFMPWVMNAKGNLSITLSNHITKLLSCLVLGSFLWLLKNLLYLKLKADLYYCKLYYRIKRAVLDFHGIQIIHHRGMWNFLTGPKNIKKTTTATTTKPKEVKQEAKQEQENMAEKHRQNIMKGKNIWLDVSKMDSDTVPICVIQGLCNTYLKQMTNVGLPRNKHVTKDEGKLLTEAWEMLKEVVREPERCYIQHKDLDKYDLTMPERLALFELFESKEEKEHRKHQGSNTDQAELQQRIISRDQFLIWAVTAYKNCWGLDLTLRSSERAFVKLNRILNVFLVTLILIIWLLLSKFVEPSQLILLITPFLAASFVFGDTCKKMFEGLIFAFVIHPFDIGDRVVIDNVQMKVTEVNILTSVFFKYDTGEEVLYPNSILANTKITNLNITPDQSDNLEFTIPPVIEASNEYKQDLELKINKLFYEDITYSSQIKMVTKDYENGVTKKILYFKYLVSYLAKETKDMHKSEIQSKIKKFMKEMELMESNAHSSSEAGPYCYTFDAKITLEQIDQLKKDMLVSRARFSGYERYKHSKVLMKNDDGKKIQMAVYLNCEKTALYIPNQNNETREIKRHIDSVTKELNDLLNNRHTWSHIAPEIRAIGKAT